MSAPRTERPAALSLPRALIGAVASGVLLSAAFPPLDFGLVALVALVPLVAVWQRTRARAAALAGFVSGVVFFGIVLWWVHNIGFVGYVPLVVVMALWWALAGAVVAGLGARSPFVIATVWVGAEFARSHWPLGGFPWGATGYALHDFAPARTVAAWGGVEFVAALVIVVNAAVVAVARARRLHFVAGVTLTLVILVLASVFRPPLASAGRFSVAVAQGNDKNRRLTLDELADRYLVRSHLRLAAQLRDRVHLVVFPESSVDADPRDDASVGAVLAAVARDHDAALLANANADAPHDRLYNTNFLYAPDGSLQGTYVKQHLVPFGEYVPWRNRLGFIHELRQVPQDFAPGRRPVVFGIAGHRVGTMICFESAFAPLARTYARLGADVLVVSTNNRSFGRSANAAQHVAMSQFRAAESGRPVIQAAISGESALIDARGRVHARTGLFQRRLVVGSVTGRHGRTPYVRFGDAPLLALVAVVILGGVLRRVRR